MRRWSGLILCVISVLIGGCAPRYSVAPEPPLLSASLQDLLGQLDRRTRSVETIKALLTIHAENQTAVTASLLFSRSLTGDPASIRLEGFDPFGRTLFDLVSSNHRVLLRLPGEGRVIESGPDKRGDLSLQSEIGLKADEFRQAVSALVGPYVQSDEIPVLERVGPNYLIHLIRVSGVGGRLTKRLWFERVRLRLIREEIFFGAGGLSGDSSSDQQTENERTVVQFFDYRPLSIPAGAEIEWPGRVVITRPRSGPRADSRGDSEGRGRLELKFQEVHPNAVISPEEYRIP
jgi:hypothetical protein